jgi:hypothetical protein
MKTTASATIVSVAIDYINRKHGYQLELNRFDRTGKWVNFTLKTKSGIPGAKKSASGRNLSCASWHAHGYVLDEIFKNDPDCVIYSAGKKLTAGFFWEDFRVGFDWNTQKEIRASQTSIF